MESGSTCRDRRRSSRYQGRSCEHSCRRKSSKGHQTAGWDRAMKKAILFTIMMCLALLISACSTKTDESASGPKIESPAEAASNSGTPDEGKEKDSSSAETPSGSNMTAETASDAGTCRQATSASPDPPTNSTLSKTMMSGTSS